MRTNPALSPASVCLAAALFAGCASQDEGTPDPFDSTRLVIQMGGMRMIEGSPAVTLGLKNKTAHRLWVAADFEAPEAGQSCSQFERIEPEASHTFVCVQDDLVFDQLYAVHFDVFADEGRTELLEEQSTELIFGSEFRELLKLVGKAQAAEEAKRIQNAPRPDDAQRP